jgi:hypothetical protein
MQMKVAVATGPLLERSEELARIESALADARAGRGRFLVIEGPAGIGKTALLAQTRTAAAQGGMRVLRSRGTELERDFAFGVVRQLFEPPLAEASGQERTDLLHGAAGVAAALLELPGAPAGDGRPSSGVDPSFAILHGLYWLCANLAAAGPLYLVVDDAHWADGPSLRYLSFLLTRLEELDAALVLATRPREAGTDAELLAALTSDPSADVIRLSPLTRAAVAQLVESRLAELPDPAFVDACLRATRGMPFFMSVLVEALSEEGFAPTAEAARHVERIGAQTVGRSIRLRLRRLPEPTGSDRAGCVRRPDCEGLPVKGAAAEPFASFPSATSFLASGHVAARHRAKPRPGCLSPRRGSAAHAALGEREKAPLRGVEGNRTPRSFSSGCRPALISVPPLLTRRVI